MAKVFRAKSPFESTCALTRAKSRTSGKNTLKSHLLSEVCGNAFTQYSSMQKHLRTHDKVKPYTCDVCEKSFSQVTEIFVFNVSRLVT